MSNLHTVFSGLLPAENILLNEPMARHTSFRTGGNADVLLVPGTEGELAAVLRAARGAGLPHHIIGRGTNLLVSDAGIAGVVIKVTYGTVQSMADGTVRVDAGASLKQLALAAANAGLGELEFAAGIPGTLGGGIVMNAGAYGGELGEYVRTVRAIDLNGSIVETSELEFAYRHSNVARDGLVVLSATLKLPPGNRESSLLRIEELAAKRREKQPLEHASAGSTFKRPQGHYAGALIEQCGMKGASCGGAMVSDKHAGFIINTGEATSADIFTLMRQTQAAVQEQTGVVLSPEVRLLGEFPHD